MLTKKFLALALAVVMLLALLPTAAFAAGVTVTEVVPCKYNQVRPFSKVGLAAVGVGEYALKWGFVDKTGKEVVPCKYDTVDEDFSEGLAAVKLDGKYGFIDQAGKEVIPCKYNSASAFSEGLAMVELNGKYGFINKASKEIIPCEYDYAGSFSEGLAAVKLNGKWGYIDQAGQEVIPCALEYDGVGPFYNGVAEVWIDVDDRRCGLIDRTGKEIVPCKYMEIGSLSEGRMVVQDSYTMVNGGFISNYGVIDETGREIVPCKYNCIGAFSGGVALVGVYPWKYGFIDKMGREITPCIYDGISDSDVGGIDYPWAGFIDGLAWVCRNGKCGFIDRTGKEVVPCDKYDSVDEDFSEGLAAVTRNDKCGYIDTTGKEVIPCKYDWAVSFSEGLARVGLNGKWGFIDKTGREVIPCKYDNAVGFSGGLAAVKMNGKWGYIDQTGQEVIPFTLEYGDVGRFEQGIAPVWTVGFYWGKAGFIDKTGKEIIPCKYDWASFVSEDLIEVVLNNKHGFWAVNVASGTLAGDGRSLDWSCSADGLVSVSGPLAEGESVLAATYDHQERFSGLKQITAAEPTARIDPSAPTMKLFWLDENLKPICPAATAWKQ